MSSDEKKRVDSCNEMQNIGHVVPDESWGDLPEHLRFKFDELKCSDVVSLNAVANFIKEKPDLYNRVWDVSADRQRVTPEPGMEGKVVATIVAMTTRTLTINKLEDLALFKDLLPSF